LAFKEIGFGFGTEVAGFSLGLRGSAVKILLDF
jgi:hypothetical protein